MHDPCESARMQGKIEEEFITMSAEDEKISFLQVERVASTVAKSPREGRTKKSFDIGDSSGSTKQKHTVNVTSSVVNDKEEGYTTSHMKHDRMAAATEECDSSAKKPPTARPQHELPETASSDRSESTPAHTPVAGHERDSICVRNSRDSPSCAQSASEGLSSASGGAAPSNRPHPPHHPQPLPLPKLTLSAFRKPEFAVRLTSSPPHKLLHHHYDLTSSSRVLGHGASSTVRLAKHKVSGRKVAVKSIGKHDILRRYAHRGRPKETLDECDILLSLKGTHETIISLLDVYETDSEVQLVLEYCAGGELFDAIQRRRHRHERLSDHGTSAQSADNPSHSHRRKRARPCNSSDTSQDTSHTTASYAKPLCSGYTEAQVARIACQLLSALTHMHRRGIVHRDVKPENIFLVSDNDEDNMTVKLSDFGLARVIPTSNASNDKDTQRSTPSHKQTFETAKVTPLTPPSEQPRLQTGYGQIASDYYAAPEVGNGYGYSTAVDMYSLGVTLYILLSGFPPAARPRCGSLVLDNDTSSSDDDSDDDDHTIHDHGNILKNASSFEFPNRHWRHITSSAKNLVRKMLHHDPTRRISAHQALQHEWVLLHLQALRIKAFASPFSSRQKPCSSSLLPSTSSRAAGSNIPVVSFSSVQFDYLASKLFESKKRKLHSSTTHRSREEDKKLMRRKSHKRYLSSTAIETQKTKEPRLNVSSSKSVVPISMVDLYSQVSSVAAAATAAAEGFMEDISETYDSTDMNGKLELGEEMRSVGPSHRMVNKRMSVSQIL